MLAMAVAAIEPLKRRPEVSIAPNKEHAAITLSSP
jgi:hypothetical protein